MLEMFDRCFNLATLGDDFDTSVWDMEAGIIDVYHLKNLKKSSKIGASPLVQWNETVPSWFEWSYLRIPRTIVWTISHVNITAFDADLNELWWPVPPLCVAPTCPAWITLRNFFCRQNYVVHEVGFSTWVYMKEDLHRVLENGHFHVTFPSPRMWRMPKH